MSLAHSLILQLNKERHRVLEVPHVGLQCVADIHTPDGFRQPSEFSYEGFHTLDKLLRIQVHPQSLRPDFSRAPLLLVEIVQHIHALIFHFDFENSRIVGRR